MRRIGSIINVCAFMDLIEHNVQDEAERIERRQEFPTDGAGSLVPATVPSVGVGALVCTLPPPVWSAPLGCCVLEKAGTD